MKSFGKMLIVFLLAAVSCWGAALHIADMDYPKKAAKEGLQGKVIVLVTFGRDGQVTRVKLLKGDPKLGKYAVMDATKSLFPHKDGSTKKVVYDFRLEDHKDNMFVRIAKLPLAPLR